MEPRYEDGAFVTQRHFEPRVYLHPTRDLAVTHLEDEEKTINMLRNRLSNTYESRLDLCDEKIVSGSPGEHVRI